MEGVLNTILNLALTTGLAALAWFIKMNFSEIKADIQKNTEDRAKDREETDKKLSSMRHDLETKMEAERQRNARSFEKVGKQISDLKEDLPFVYTTREDFIRSMNGVDAKMGSIDNKIDKLLEKMGDNNGSK